MAHRNGAAASQNVSDVIDRKLQVLFSPALRARLEQGKNEPAIAAILSAGSAEELRAVIVKLSLADPSFVDVVNKYLKQIVIVKVKLSDFHPKSKTVERKQIPTVIAEFEDYLEKQLASAGNKEDVLAVLQIE